MKNLFIVICLMLFVVPVFAGESSNFSHSTAHVFTEPQHLNIIFSGDNHTMTWTPDGTVLIDDKPLDRLSDPEIKEAIKSIAESLINSRSDMSLLKQYDNQTTFLLQELEKCRAVCGYEKK